MNRGLAMNLRKQLFLAFCSVAIVPLAVVTLYMFVSNLTLAFNLYEQNLSNSTQIQSALAEENMNQLMARTTRFTSLRTVQNACRTGDKSLLKSQELSRDILNFTDETLDNVSFFALLDQNDKILYFSGSNSDRLVLQTVTDLGGMAEEQLIREIAFGDNNNNLLIDTPVREDGSVTGRLLAVCRTDYVLRLISGHKQVESSNAFIYCTEHEQIVTSKQHIKNSQLRPEKMKEVREQGSFIGSVDNQKVLACYRAIAKTSWVLVSTIPVGQILSRIWSYGLVNTAALLLAAIAVVLLSRRQSRRMLHPLEQLLDAVEQFFVSGTTRFPQTDIAPHTEIGYLAGKFAGMSRDMAAAQGKVRESNYLYAALMRATYEFRMVIDLQANTVECSDGEISARLDLTEGESAPERVLNLWKKHVVYEEAMDDVLSDIAYGRLREPEETEICYRWEEKEEAVWYRIIAVPIVDADNRVCRMVIHFENITRRKRREFGLIHTSQVDPLCGLFNKTAFPLYCMQSGPGKSDAVFFIDLDQFKQVNDMLGHAAGDEVLIAAAAAIRGQFRDSDTVGRFGGDEFVVFVPNITQAQAERKADALVRAVSFRRCSPQGAEIHVTASVGVCMAQSPMALEEAVRIADEAMYRAKEHGKAQYYIAKQGDTKKEQKDEI